MTLPFAKSVFLLSFILSTSAPVWADGDPDSSSSDDTIEVNFGSGRTNEIGKIWSNQEEGAEYFFEFVDERLVYAFFDVKKFPDEFQGLDHMANGRKVLIVDEDRNGSADIIILSQINQDRHTNSISLFRGPQFVHSFMRKGTSNHAWELDLEGAQAILDEHEIGQMDTGVFDDVFKGAPHHYELEYLKTSNDKIKDLFQLADQLLADPKSGDVKAQMDALFLQPDHAFLTGYGAL